MRRRLRLEGPTLDEVRRQMAREHGPSARIVSAQRVTEGGIGGFFARQHFEVEVEVGDHDEAAAVSFDLPSRVGIAALLSGADSQDDLDPATPAAALQAQASGLSTRSHVFSDLLADLSTQHAATAVEAAPRVRDAPGDLVCVVGFARDHLDDIAHLLAGHVASTLVLPGAPGTEGAVIDRRSATAARAESVRRGQPALVTFDLTADVTAACARLVQAAPDQVWAVVDASRKPADTAAWVDQVRSHVAVTALAVVGAEHTTTPQTVNELAVPVGWVGSEPATSAHI